MLNEAETRLKIITALLILIVGIGTLLQFLEDHKMDDEPVRIPFSSTLTTTNSNYVGTASGTTTTL